MQRTGVYQLIQTKIHKAQEYYKKHGLWKLLLYCFDRIGIVFKRESIFFEITIAEIAPYHGDTSNASLDFVRIKQEDDFGQLEFPDDDEWITKDGALKWLNDRDCILLALKDGNKIVCYQWVDFGEAYIPFFHLSAYIPDNTAYSLALYTVPEYRGKRYASHLKSLVLQYLKDLGYQRAFVVIEPDNKASQRVNKKFGFKEYQTVLYRRFLFLKYYRVKDYETPRKKIFWAIKNPPRELWNIFSKIGHTSSA